MSSRITIIIETNTLGFSESVTAETARILERLAQALRDGAPMAPQILRDHHNNPCGRVDVRDIREQGT